VYLRKRIVPRSRWLRAVGVLAAFPLMLFAYASRQPTAGTTTFVVDGDRVYAELAFVRPDGTLHRALAFVDLGSPSTSLDGPLYRELGLDRRRPLTFLIGDLDVTVNAEEVTNSGEGPGSIGSDLAVEAVLPAGVMRRYQVVIDYAHRRLTLARPATVHPVGVPVPFHANDKTGLVAVDAVIDGHSYPITIDNGSAYTWFRQSIVWEWLRSHPEWQRGVGAVGPSNMRMAADGAEASGTMLRVPKIELGALDLRDVGALGVGPGKGDGGSSNLFDWYSTKNALPVIGWLGGNVLKGFQITLDYPTHTMYWLKQTEIDPHDLDQVGLTLERQGDAYVIAGIATREGKPTVEGVQTGDTLLQVDALVARGASRGAIYSALHGNPGDTRTLTLARNGRQFVVQANVIEF
jgi:hypothetical protein